MTVRIRAFASAAPRDTTRQREADVRLAEKFNLSTLNGGKNPFEVSSNRLLKSNTRQASTIHGQRTKAPRVASKKTTKKDIRDVYSLDYLMGKPVAPKRRGSKNPFDVASAKLM